MNKPDLPDSLNAFGRQLEDAVRRRQRRFVRPPRLPRRTGRLTAGVGLAAVGGAAAAVAILLGSSATSPAYAVSQNGNGTVTVRWLRVSKINPATIGKLNQRLHALGIKAKVVPAGLARVQAVAGKACPKLAPITLRPGKLKPGVKVTVDPAGRLGILPPKVQRVLGQARQQVKAHVPVNVTAGGVHIKFPPGPPPAGLPKVPPNVHIKRQIAQRVIRLPHGAVVARCGPPPVVMPGGPPAGTATNGTGTTTGTETVPDTGTVTAPATTSSTGTATAPTTATATTTAVAPDTGTATTSSTSAHRGGGRSGR